MESTLSILFDYIKEFIPANRGHFLAAGVGSILIGSCIMLTAITSGLSGNLTYLALHPGVSVPAILGGLGMIGAALTLKLPQG